MKSTNFKFTMPNVKLKQYNDIYKMLKVFIFKIYNAKWTSQWQDGGGHHQRVPPQKKVWQGPDRNMRLVLFINIHLSFLFLNF